MTVRRTPRLLFLRVDLDDPRRRAVGLLLFILGVVLECLIWWSSNKDVVSFARLASPVVFITSASVLVLSIPGMWRLRLLYPRDRSAPIGHASATRWTVFALILGAWWALKIALTQGVEAKDVSKRIGENPMTSLGVLVLLAAAFVSGSLMWSLITLAFFWVPIALGVPWFALSAILVALVGRQMSCPVCGTTVGLQEVEKLFLREEQGYQTHVHRTPRDDQVEVIDRYSGRSRSFTVRGTSTTTTTVPVVNKVFQVRRKCAVCGHEDFSEKRE
jgi:hypothetical protein